MLQRFLLLFPGLFLLFLFPAAAADSSNQGQITITEYEHEDYFRHPRMEEEDRLRGRSFQFQPGLEIITDVDDAEIEFFEERIGKTPWEQDNLSPGAYRIRLERTGYEVIEFWVNVRSDRRTVVLVNMDRPAGTLVLQGLPPEAVVTIDRLPVEGTEITAAAGTRILKVSAFGWETVQTELEIPSGTRIEWHYEGKRSAFSLETVRIRPKVLPPGDIRGFTIEWKAGSGGSADLSITDPEGNPVTVIPFAVSSSGGTIEWVPESGDEKLPDGEYRVVISGTGYDSSPASSESFLRIDSRFRREGRPAFTPLPGLLYAPGTAMLPEGIWQVSTGAGMYINEKEIPVNIGIRFSPVRRLEFTGKFRLTPRDPFDTTSIGMDFSAAWRANPGTGPFTVNLAMLFSYEGFAADFNRIPPGNPGITLPGIQFSIPMEYALGKWNFVLSPSVYVIFLGNNPEDWQFSGPVRAAGGVGAGLYYENNRFLIGASMALRSPDYPRDFLNTSLWSGLEGRFDLPGDASYFALYAGVRTLDTEPKADVGVEFGIIR